MKRKGNSLEKKLGFLAVAEHRMKKVNKVKKTEGVRNAIFCSCVFGQLRVD